MKRRSAVLIAALFVSSASVADVTLQYKEWADGPVRHLMTREEWKQWKAIQSNDEAKAFIDLFWARRDPTPATARNEFREEFDQRVAFADQQFSSGRMRGALSDAGRVFILLGPPYRVSGRAGVEAESATIFGGRRPPVDSNGQIVVGRATREADKQYWMYAHDRKPKFGPSDFTLVFADEGSNDWKLAHTERVNPDAILQQAAIASIVSPHLTKAPVYAPEPPHRTTTFKSADLKAAYEQFRSGEKPTLGSAAVTWGEFVTAEGEHFVSAQLYVPGTAVGQKITFLTVVESPAGEIIDVREEETSLIAVGQDAYVDRSLVLDRGTYNATFAIASGGRLVSASRVPITIEGLDPAATAVSPLFLASSIVPLKEAWLPDDPFTFGGLKVIPKGDGVFQPTGDLWYFVELRNPGKTDAGTPYVRVQVDIEGKTAKGPVALNLPMKDANLARLAGETNRYGLGTAIPLEGFIPGDYRMKVHVVDVVLGKDYRFEKAFRVATR